MPKKQKPKKTGRISFISVSRLYNLGNYQNVKYELGAEVEKGQSPSETLIKLVGTLHSLRPITRPSSQCSLDSARKKKLSERSEYEKEHYSEWLEEERAYRRAMDARRAAVQAMDELGGASQHTDHTLNWEDTPW